MNSPINTRIVTRRRKTWEELNPILDNGEPGFDSSTNRLKVGDGRTAWNQLPYATPTTNLVKPSPFTLASGYVAATDDAQMVQQYRSIGGATGNFMKAHTLITEDATMIRLAYGNFWGNDEPYGNAITIRSGVFLWSAASGAWRPITFGGRESVTIAPGGLVVSDPVAAEFIKGDNIVTTTFVDGGVGGDAPANYFTGAGTGNRKSTSSAYVDGWSGTWNNDASHWGYGPMAVLAQPSSPVNKLLSIVGDSLVYGFGDYPTHVGFVTRAALRDGIPFVKVAMPSESAGAYAQAHIGYQRRMFTQGSTHAVVNYGANDSGFRTVAQFKADILKIWSDLDRRGVKVIAMTVGPKTDGDWSSVNGQTVRNTSGGSWSDSDLTEVNTWIRSKPYSKLAGVYDYADVIMSSRNSNRWRNNGGVALTGDGTHPNEAGHAYLTANLNLKTLLT